MATPTTVSIVSDHLSKSSGDAVSSARAKDLHDFVVAQPHGKQMLEYLASQQNAQASTSILRNPSTSWKRSVDATGSMAGFWIYMSEQVNVPGLKKRCTWTSWGLLVGLPGGFITYASLACFRCDSSKPLL